MKIGCFIFEIIPQFVDFQLNITLSSLFDLILTSSGRNADDNGFGIRDLNRIGGTWVLSRFAIELEYLPKQYDKITIETWVEEVHTYNTIRNFRIKNERGEIIGKAVSVWFMINMKTRRPMEMKLLEGIEKYIVEEPSGIERPLKLESVNRIATYGIQAKYSDIDINQHVYAGSYLRWMVDCLPLDFYKTHRLKRFDINFMNELFFGDEVEVHHMETAEKDYRFDITKNEVSVCRGRLKF